MASKANKEKGEAWDALSKYVRIKECLETTDLPFVGVCFTCGRRFHILALDAGHYVSGRRNAILFEEQGVHIQCRHYCNIHLHGNTKKYKERLIEYYKTEEDPKAGIKVVKRLEALKHKIVRNKEMDFPAIAKKYTEKYKAIMHKQGYGTWTELLQGN